MGDISVFYNNRIVGCHSHFLCTGDHDIADTPVNFGNFCLTPVRYLFDGNKVTLSLNISGGFLTNVMTVVHEKESMWPQKRDFLRLIASIVFLIPGILLGSIFKGLGYLSKDVREKHALAVRHYTPIDRTIGDDNNRLDLKGIIQKLDDERINNHLNQPTKSLVIYAQPSTDIVFDPGFLDLDPQKIVLDGAKIVDVPNNPTSIVPPSHLDAELGKSNDWDNGNITGLPIVNNGVPLPGNTRVIQWKVKSINDAIQDILPLKSIFSTERLRRVYVV